MTRSPQSFRTTVLWFLSHWGFSRRVEVWTGVDGWRLVGDGHRGWERVSEEEEEDLCDLRTALI